MRTPKELLNDARERGHEYNKEDGLPPFNVGDNVYCGNFENLQDKLWIVTSLKQDERYFTGWKVCILYEDITNEVDSSWCWEK